MACVPRSGNREKFLLSGDARGLGGLPRGPIGPKERGFRIGSGTATVGEIVGPGGSQTCIIDYKHLEGL